MPSGLLLSLGLDFINASNISLRFLLWAISLAEYKSTNQCPLDSDQYITNALKKFIYADYFSHNLRKFSHAGLAYTLKWLVNL